MRQAGIENEFWFGMLRHEARRLHQVPEVLRPIDWDYHGAAADAVHVTDWDASGVGEGGVLDVTKLGLEELSMRVRVGRNLADFNLPGLMDQAERIKFETTMLKAFQTLIDDPEFKGTIYSMSPDHGEGVENPNKIDDAKYKELVDAHLIQGYGCRSILESAGISSDWPYGRGCYQSEDKECIIWFGEEDQLHHVHEEGHKTERSFDQEEVVGQG